MMTRQRSFLLMLLTLCCFLSVHAQTTDYRSVYWLHDINEDIPQKGIAAHTDSRYWQQYAGRAGQIPSIPNVDNCQISQGYFTQYRQMSPNILNYYSDRYIPDFTKSNYGIKDYKRDVLGDAKSLSQLADSIVGATFEYDADIFGPLRPIAITQGSGTLLTREIMRTSRNSRFGSVISIGGAHDGVELVRSVRDGKVKGFEDRMKDELDAGATEYRLQFTSTFIQGILGFVGPILEALGVPDKFLTDAIQKLIDGFSLLGTAAGFTIPPWDFSKVIADPMRTLTSQVYEDFTKYIIGAYSPTYRPGLSDMIPQESPFLQKLSQTPEVPMINISGGADQSFFRISHTTKPQIAPQVQCQSNNENDFSSGIGQAHFFHSSQQTARVSGIASIIGANVFFTGLSIFLTITTLDPGVALGLQHIWNTLLSIPFTIASIDHLGQQYLRGEEWLDRGADAGWAPIIGATKTITYTDTRYRRRCADGQDDPPCDPEPYQVQVTATVIEDNDGIVGKTSQTNIPSILNYTANKADHFTQSNHPNVRNVLDDIFSSNKINFQVPRKP